MDRAEGDNCDGSLLTYRCPACRKLVAAELGHEGDRCPHCDSGRLETVSRVTQRMREQHETARAG